MGIGKSRSFIYMKRFYSSDSFDCFPLFLCRKFVGQPIVDMFALNKKTHHEFRRTQKHPSFHYARRTHGNARGDLLRGSYDRHPSVWRSEYQHPKLRQQKGGYLAEFGGRGYRGEINFGIK